jgi:DNA mismatch endonuclease (patch repair protein)
MADVVAPQVRSRMMAGIRGKNTKPEMIIRRGLHQRGFRFLVHDRRLPGKPDLVFPKWRAAIFVNGCFWHGHDCHLFKWPSTRTEFWREKIKQTLVRDQEALVRLLDGGWRVAEVWECALKGSTKLSEYEILDQCASWLRSAKPNLVIAGV